MKRILITGSRDWTDIDTIYAALEQQLADHGEITVVHGGAAGADRIAGDWAKAAITDQRPVRLEVYPPDWDSHGRKAGIIRNQQMVNTKPDVVLAFPLGASRGTRHCMRAAANAGIVIVNHGDE